MLYLSLGIALSSAMAFCGYGFVLQKVFLGRIASPSLAPALGISGAIATAFLFGHSGLLNPLLQWLAWPFVCVGIGSFCSGIWANRSLLRQLIPTDRYARVLGIVFLIFWGQSFLLGLVPQLAVKDVTHYHLYGPLLWFLDGKITFPESHPDVFLTSLWEYLYLWPILLRSAFPGDPAPVAHIAAQEMHAILGFGYAAFLFRAWMRAWGTSEFIAMATAVFGSLSLALYWTAWNAKTDYGTLSFLLAAALCFRKVNTDRYWVRMGAFFLGMGIATKWTSAPAAGAILFLESATLAAWWRASDTRGRLHAIILFVVPATAILVRNYLGSGLPLYPTSPGANTYPLWGPVMNLLWGPTAAAELNFSDFSRRMLEFDKTYWLIPLALLLWLRSRDATSLRFLVAAVFIFACAFFSTRKLLFTMDHARYFVFSACLSYASVGLSLDRSFPLRWLRPALSTVIVFFLWFFVPLHASILPHLTKPPSWESAVYENEPSGGCRRWIRENAAKSDAIAAINDSMLYYMAEWNYRTVPGNADLERIYLSAKDSHDLFSKLREARFQYLLFVFKPSEYLSLRPDLLESTERFVREHPSEYFNGRCTVLKLNGTG